MAGDVAVRLGGHRESPRLAFDGDVGRLEELAVPEGESPDDAHLGHGHPNRVCGIDHVVVSTPDFERTASALREAGLEELGRRSGEIGGLPVEQAFHRAGSCLLELVGRPGAGGDGAPSVWGITFVTEDLGLLPALEPPPVASIRDAVQPGRQIAVARAGIDLPTRVAFMSPR